jgi:hypothetical protein
MQFIFYSPKTFGATFRLLIRVHHSPTKEKNRERFRKDEDSYFETTDYTDGTDWEPKRKQTEDNQGS